LAFAALTRSRLSPACTKSAQKNFHDFPMKSIRVVVSIVLGLLILFTGFGCNRGGSKRPVKAVTVKVTYKGQPVDGANVTFISEEPDAIAAFGMTDAQGVAKPTTPEAGNGVVLGKHKVLVNKEQITNEKKAADQESADYVPPPPGGAPVPTVKHLIPEKYSVPGETPLTAEVSASGPAEFTFDLTD
jgi:hypothetical protein